MAVITQFYLLMYKNWKLQLRKKFVTAVELLIPVALCLLLVAIRSLINVNTYPEPTTYPSYSVDTLPSSLKLFKSPVLNIAYTPKTLHTRKIMDQVVSKLYPKFGQAVANDTEEDMVKFLSETVSLQFNGTKRTVAREIMYLAGVVFENPESYKSGIPHNISYTIRPMYSPRNSSFKLSLLNTWYTNYLFVPFDLPGPRDKGKEYGGAPGYYDEGFLTLQHTIDETVISILNPSASANISQYSTKMERFPYPPYTDDLFLTAIQTSFPFFIMLCFIFFSLSIPKEITLEKERRLKESMRMMGMSNWLQWLSWFTKYFIFLLFTTFLMALILCPPFKSSPKVTVFTASSFTLIWFFFLMFAISIICYSFMISVFFSKANSSAAAGGIIFFLSYIPFSSLSANYGTLSRVIKMSTSLDLNIAMSFGMVIIGKYEGTGVGVQWNNLNQPVTVDDNITFGEILLMLFVDSLIYLLIMWYVEAIFPGPFGIPQRPYFFVLPSYWCGTKQNISRGRGSSVLGIDNDAETTDKCFEKEPQHMEAGIQIQNLTKTFKSENGKKIAVNNLNLNMYNGQITALLGHNGAGKTTTMFMLTGFIPPTSGTALVNGYDIRKDIASVRSSLGLCPQHDILFDSLTVEEHLYFFAKLKGCSNSKIKTEIDYYIETLGLEEKRSAFASTLSGGQRRKLSVGIALIGDSKIVILDEPTSGMDPSARRHMWDVLQAQRAGRTMILSTHFMDEADHLGDRVAILADGVIQCCGSSMFLKKKYGAGYHMVMTKKSDCDVKRIHDLLIKHVPEAKLESNVGAELSYILPDDKVSAFPGMFAELEQTKDSLGILGFGASVTTMEEVFMKVGEASVDEEEKHEAGAAATNGKYNRFDTPDENESILEMTERPVSVSHYVKNSGAALFAQQFRAMLVKRMLYTLRNKLLTISQIALPLIFTAITIAIMKTLPTGDKVPPKMPFNLDMYGDTIELYSRESSSYTGVPVSKVYADLFQSSSRQTAQLTTNPYDEILSIAKDLKKYKFETIIAMDYRNINGSDVTALFNGQPYHAAPTALLYSDTALLKAFANDSYTFAAANHPLPQSSTSKILSKANTFNGASFAYSSNMMFGFSFVAASFVVFLIKERFRKTKHSQIVSGVKWYNFWLSTFTWDFINYMVPALLTVCLFPIADVKNLADVSNGNMQPLYLIILMVMFVLASLPNMYVMQYLFTGPATGYVVVAFYNLLTGTFPQLVITILKSIESTKAAAKVVDWVFIVLLPNYNMGSGISNLYTNYEYMDLCYRSLPQSLNRTEGKDSLHEICSTNFKNTPFPCCVDNCGDNCLGFQENYFAWESLGIGKSMVFLSLQILLFWMIVVIIETEILIKLFYKFRPQIIVTPQIDELEKDADVMREREKIQFGSDAAGNDENQVVIAGLTKYYADHKAVDDLYVAIPKGECFGLLGVNGAGKTTTFKMLTGDETISGGTAYMNGKNIRTDIHEIQKSLGYCPQFDALIDQMTGEEMLYMYARLRGIPEQSIPIIVSDLLTSLMLNKHKRKLTKDYSGGNKRKLSTAIALIGDPPIVFLDEPTTGMDPVAKRMLWKSLTAVRDSGKTLILTSHSMEECEALCTRMAIMVNGKYRCLGSTQHLKNKFGAGYTLIARVSYPEDGSLPNIQAVETFVEETFPGSILKDKHQNLVQYQVPKDNMSWAMIFQKMEDHKIALQIEDYLVSQTSLEQVFINFARAQIDPSDFTPGCGKRLRQNCCLCCIPEYVVSAAPSYTSTPNV